MIVEINADTIGQIKNPAFRKYADMYVDIYNDFMSQVQASGIQIDPVSHKQEVRERTARLAEKGAVVRNAGKSIVVNQISTACEACQTGVGSSTFFVSLRCHRNCYYCFNPNQEGYEFFLNPENKRDLIAELDQVKAKGLKVSHLALTGGEPLLYKEEAVAFFQHAYELFPEAHTRLYTSGDHIKEDILQALKDAHLDEIRFSIRLHDQEQGIRYTLDRIKLAKDYIPAVMVEMPIVPGEVEAMKGVLKELDDIGLYSINLLEFCYPFNNMEVFNNLNYKVKKYPYRVLYNYWYAGGLPISQSELDCLELLEYALDEGLKMGVHYCSLENKHTGQVYQANHGQPYQEMIHFSEKDYFLKTAKAFGEDVPAVKKKLLHTKGAKFQYNEEHDYLEFQVRKIPVLAGLDVQIGISSNVMETRQDGTYLRELQVDLCRPEDFDFSEDV